MNPTDIADVVLMNKLIAVDGLSSDVVFNGEVDIEIPLFVFFSLKMSNDMKMSTYQSIWTEMVYTIDVWKKIESQDDIDFLSGIIEKIDTAIVGQDVYVTFETEITDTYDVYMLMSCQRETVDKSYYREGKENWECRTATYTIRTSKDGYFTTTI